MDDETETPETCGIPVWYGDRRLRCDILLEENGECQRHGRRGGGYARDLFEDFSRRAGYPRSGTDAYAGYELMVLRDTVQRLEIILDDEGVPPATARRVVRCMLYGSPSQSAAELRARQEQELAKLLSERTTSVTFPADMLEKLRLPPK